MFPCHRDLCFALDAAGAAFLIAAVAGSFWFCFVCGALLLLTGLLWNRR